MDGLTPGSEFGHLRIERTLGRGGFATVYLARDTRLGRLVALKALSTTGLHGTSLDEFEGFLAEARIIARLQSPNVVTLFQLHELPSSANADSDAAMPSLVLEMEYVSGGSLQQVAASGGLPLDRIQSCLRDILLGLGAAHSSGVLHRDLKPANVLLTESGVAKLTDFGLARMIADEIDLDDDGSKGTPLYMSPELLFGGGASERSDIWSFGVVAYELLAGRLPFPLVSAASFFAAVQNETPDPLPPLIPAPLRTLVARCLTKDPDQRPASCAEVLALLDSPVEPAPPAAASRSAAAQPSLFGRSAELKRIDEVLAAGSDGANTLVLTGAAGIGKTALCAEAATRARSRGVLWMDVRLSRVEGPLTTLVEAARNSVLGGDDPATAGFGPDGARLKELLHGEELPALDSPQQARWTLLNLLSGVANARPLAICVDDAQHASEEDVALLADLARWFSDRPFTLVVASRPDSPATAAFAGAHRLDLGGVDREAMFELLEERGAATLPARVAVHLHRHSEGNPLQALELLRHLEETGSLVRRQGRLEPTEHWRDATVPARLRDVVHARLAALDESDRALLDVAAVDGREFDGRAVASVLGVPMLQVLRQLQQLCHGRTLIAPAPRGYRFADMPTQEVLYEDMAPELRTELHRALAEHLEGRDANIDASRLARHWARAGDRARAAPYLLCVAQRAHDRQEMRRFIELVEQAGMLEDPPLIELRDHFELALGVASVLMSRGRVEDATRIHTLLLGQTADDETVHARVEVARAASQLLAGIQPEAGREYWRACADRLGETMEGARARSIVGRLAKLAGDLDTARAAFEEADRLFVALKSERSHAAVLDFLGSVAMRDNRLKDARELYAAAAAATESMGLPTSAAVSRSNAALAGMLAGQIDGIAQELRRSIRTFDLAGSFGHAAHARLYLAEALFAEGRTTETLATVDAALPALERSGHGIALTNALRLRAELLAILDRLPEAAQSIERALEYAAAGADRTQLLVALAIDAAIATAQGRLDDAAIAVASMRAANPDGTIHADGFVLALAEAVLFGLPASELESVGHFARLEPEQLLRDATLAWAAGRAFDEPLRKLEALSIGLRAVSYRLLTNWLAAEQALRAGDADEARARTDAALEAATLLGHTRAQAKLR